MTPQQTIRLNTEKLNRTPTFPKSVPYRQVSDLYWFSSSWYPKKTQGMEYIFSTLLILYDADRQSQLLHK